jgi:hypothetical protein
MSTFIKCLTLAIASGIAAWFAAPQIHRIIHPQPTVEQRKQSLFPDHAGDFFEPLKTLTTQLNTATPEDFLHIFDALHDQPYTTWQRAYSLDLLIRRWIIIDPANAIKAISSDPELLAVFVDKNQQWFSAIQEPESALPAIIQFIPLYYQVNLIEQLITISKDAQRVGDAISTIEDSSIRLRAATAFVSQFKSSNSQAVSAWADKNQFLAAAAGFKKT